MTSAAGLPLPKLTRGRFACSVTEHTASGSAGVRPSLEICAYTDEALMSEHGVRIAFAERSGGESTGDFASLNLKTGIGDQACVVERNRAAALAALGAPGIPCIVPNQVHGTRVLKANSSRPCDLDSVRQEAEEGCDAVVVGCSMLAALLCFADCLPLVVVAPTGKFALAHCGWRGAIDHLARLALCALLDEARCAPNQVNAYIGPYIHQECFAVDDGLALRFAQEFGSGAVSSVGKDEAASLYVDLGACVRKDLVDAGVCPERIADAGVCTCCNSERFFSYRAHRGACGRHGAFAFRVERESV